MVGKTKSCDFYFDIGSPAAYLAWTQIPKLAQETGAQIHLIPFLLGAVFKATGNTSPVFIPAKGQWLIGDLQRWAKHYGIAALKMPPSFPVNTLPFMRALVGTQMRDPARFQALGDALYVGMFEQGLDMNDMNVVATVLSKAGFDPAAIMALTQDAEVKARLVSNTEAAIKAGAFGAPTFVVNGELFWGQDRMRFVTEALLS
jgi:2-hydroxychromene-2-carboxylate isomerase